MKMNPIKKFPFCLGCGILVLLASAAGAVAQSNRVPGPDDYTMFSQFITGRNIFDPNRVAHDYTSTRRPTRTRTQRGTPGVQLVGTMSYEKGMFAFFSGNNTDMSKILQSGQQILGYTVTSISTDSVGLESADKKEQLELKIGDGFRQENNKWVFSKAGEIPVEVSAPAPVSSDSSDSSAATPAAAPASTTEQNDVLKRLMQQREKENQ